MRNQKNKKSFNRSRGLIYTGLSIIAIGIIMAIIGGFSQSLNNPPAAITPGFVLFMFAVLIVIIGITVACAGKYYLNRQIKHPEEKTYPILTTIFVVGIIILLFFLYLN